MKNTTINKILTGLAIAELGLLIAETVSFIYTAKKIRAAIKKPETEDDNCNPDNCVTCAFKGVCEEAKTAEEPNVTFAKEETKTTQSLGTQ